MRFLIFLFTLSLQAQTIAVKHRQVTEAAPPPPTCTPKTGYSHCRVLTIDHTQVPSTQTDVPVLVSATLGGSRVQNASCYDVVFSSNSDGSTLIPWEQEACTQSTGVGLWWVYAASLSSSVDTNLYVHYGNVSISTAQNTSANAPANVWKSSMVSVVHLRDGSTLSGSDSTTNANDFWSFTATAGAGKVDGAANFAATQTMAGSGAASWNLTGNLTIEAWVKTSSSSELIFAGYENEGSYAGFGLRIGAAGALGFYSGPVGWVNGSAAVNDNAWHHVAASLSGTTVSFYVDGTLDTAQTSAAPNSWTGNKSLGHPTSNTDSQFLGLIDEFRLYNVSSTTNWIRTSYNAQASPTTFCVVGAEV